MDILITGHRGFIGRHLVDELTDAGHNVAGVDLAGSASESTPLRWLGCDLGEDGKIEKVLNHFNPEVVVHLAAQVGRVLGEDDVRHTIRENAELTTLLARECARRGVRVLYASSSEVYGDRDGATCWEWVAPALPHNLYGLSKRWGEEALRLYAPEGLQIVRLSMPYGPGAPPGRGRRALDNILWQANTGQRIPIHKGAERSWCWIGDTVAGIRLVLEEGERYTPLTRPLHREELGLGVYNIGRDDVPIGMYELAVQCCEVVGADTSLIDMVAPPPAQTVVKRLATDKLRNLGWSPTVELPEGLPRVFEWIKGFDIDGLPAGPDGAKCSVCGGPLEPDDLGPECDPTGCPARTGG